MHFESEEVLMTIILGTILVLFFALVIILLYLLFQKKKQKYLKEKQLLQVQFKQELLQTQLEIQEQTLKTISEEIHDNIGQVLSLAKLNLNTFEEIENVVNQTKINDTKNLVGKAINDLRDLSRSLHGDKIAELGLQESIACELTILQNTGQFQTCLNSSGTPYRLEPQKEMVLFRIMQEAMNNAIKHAKAKNISVQLIYQPTSLLLNISDNGTGFNPVNLPSKGTGIGLKSMQNRAVLIGATFSISSTEGYGTVINIELKK